MGSQGTTLSSPLGIAICSLLWAKSLDFFLPASLPPLLSLLLLLSLFSSSPTSSFFTSSPFSFSFFSLWNNNISLGYIFGLVLAYMLYKSMPWIVKYDKEGVDSPDNILGSFLSQDENYVFKLNSKWFTVFMEKRNAKLQEPCHLWLSLKCDSLLSNMRVKQVSKLAGKNMPMLFWKVNVLN